MITLCAFSVGGSIIAMRLSPYTRKRVSTQLKGYFTKKALALGLLISLFSIQMASIPAQSTSVAGQTNNYITCSGSFTLNPIETYIFNSDARPGDYNYTLIEDWTIQTSIPFENLILTFNDTTGDFIGSVRTRGNFVADWSVSFSSYGYVVTSVSIDDRRAYPHPSGQFTGSFDVEVHGRYVPDEGSLRLFLDVEQPDSEFEWGGSSVNVWYNITIPQNPNYDGFGHWILMLKGYGYMDFRYYFGGFFRHLNYYLGGFDIEFDSVNTPLQIITYSGDWTGTEYFGTLELNIDAEEMAIEEKDRGVKLMQRSGNVEILREGTDEWIPCKGSGIVETLGAGDRIKTGRDSWARIQFSDGSAIHLGSNTKFRVEDTGEEQTILDLIKGRIRGTIIKGKRQFVVRTPTAVNAIRGTEFTMEVSEDNATTIQVFEGVVEVQDITSGSSVLLEADQRLTIPQTPGGLEEQELNNRIETFDTNTIEIWWEEQLLPLACSLTCSVSDELILVGGSITVSGSLEPELQDETIILTFRKPDGSIFTRSTTTDLDGSLSDSYNPAEIGSWSVKASWEGDTTYGGATSQTMEFTVVEAPPPSSLKTIVQDLNGNPISGATVSSTSQPSGQQTLSGSSGTDGSVLFSDVKSGSYTFQASKSDYVTRSGSGSVTAGETTVITLTLEKERPMGGIPGFPYESIIIGLFLGVLVVALSFGKSFRSPTGQGGIHFSSQAV